ncbi:MAG: glycosyltransferase family 2 protein [Myxococcota bacterium]
MVTALTWTIVALALVLLVPALVLWIECLASVFPLKRIRPRLEEGLKTTILVPAHDESASIGSTVSALREQIREEDQILVVADNCTDDTAQRAVAAGARAIERQDPEHRGKGYALRFGVESMSSDPPDVVIVVDADCRLSPGSVETLAAQAVALNRPVQGEYTFDPPTRTPLTMVSALALLVRNRARPRGLRRLGLPCQLTGSGMAFPWKMMRDAPELRAHLVEDLLLGAELAIAGTPPFHSVEAEVTSELPDNSGAALQQRKRWEHGQLGTLIGHGPKLLGLGIRRLNVGLMALGADLIVPPLALLCGVSLLLLGAALAVVLAGAPWALVAAPGLVLGVIASAVGLAWLFHGRREVPFRYLLAAPLYLLWKVPLYLSFSLGRREREWRRTDR